MTRSHAHLQSAAGVVHRVYPDGDLVLWLAGRHHGDPHLYLRVLGGCVLAMLKGGREGRREGEERERDNLEAISVLTVVLGEVQLLHNLNSSLPAVPKLTSN